MPEWRRSEELGWLVADVRRDHPRPGLRWSTVVARARVTRSLVASGSDKFTHPVTTFESLGSESVIRLHRLVGHLRGSDPSGDLSSQTNS